jgi:anti-sigma factor RsiW
MTTALGGDLTCKEFVELVTSYIDDRMPAEDRIRFEEHIHWCPACMTYLTQVRSTIRLAGKLTERDLPGPAKDALLGAFRNWKRSAK